MHSPSSLAALELCPRKFSRDKVDRVSRESNPYAAVAHMFLVFLLAACRSPGDTDDTEPNEAPRVDASAPTLPGRDGRESTLCYYPATPTYLVGRMFGRECVPLACDDDTEIRTCEASYGACVLGDCVSIACSGYGCSS